MAFRTTLGWSLLSSGVVTLLLAALPGSDTFWGLSLVTLGLVVLYRRQTRGF
jgi:hypothetical protein